MASTTLLYTALIALIAIETIFAVECNKELRYECSPRGEACDLFMTILPEERRTTVTCPSSFTVCAAMTFYLEENGLFVNALVADCNRDESTLPSGCYDEDGLNEIDPLGAQSLRDVELINDITYRDIEICKCEEDYCNTEGLKYRSGAGSLHSSIAKSAMILVSSGLAYFTASFS